MGSIKAPQEELRSSWVRETATCKLQRHHGQWFRFRVPGACVVTILPHFLQTNSSGVFLIIESTSSKHISWVKSNSLTRSQLRSDRGFLSGSGAYKVVACLVFLLAATW